MERIKADTLKKKEMGFWRKTKEAYAAKYDHHKDISQDNDADNADDSYRYTFHQPAPPGYPLLSTLSLVRLPGDETPKGAMGKCKVAWESDLAEMLAHTAMELCVGGQTDGDGNGNNEGSVRHLLGIVRAAGRVVDGGAHQSRPTPSFEGAVLLSLSQMHASLPTDAGMYVEGNSGYYNYYLAPTR